MRTDYGSKQRRALCSCVIIFYIYTHNPEEERGGRELHLTKASRSDPFSCTSRQKELDDSREREIAKIGHATTRKAITFIGLRAVVHVEGWDWAVISLGGKNMTSQEG